jgi:hypothetical protein
MLRTTTPLAVSLLAVSLLATARGMFAPTPTPAPIPGPGGVIDTARKFIAAVDGGDARSLAAILDVQSGGGGVVVTPDADSKWGFTESKKPRSPRFVDVTWDGTAFSEHDRKDFVHHVRGQISGTKRQARSVTSKILSIRADCPAASVSYAVIEFERSYTVDGKRQGTRRLVATALMRHVRKTKDTDPDFRIFQWHASRVAPRKVAATKLRRDDRDK